ncbi:MAG: SpoIID/LytB domain-containing protein [Myxococcales bacterium]|nr:SpoIID/LytB domain-containing protein [Myxococcales bacterium]
MRSIVAILILIVSSAARSEEIRIEIARGVVKTVNLEEYVAGVVAAEVPPAWPLEALKAQAVAARTFAVAQKVAQGPAARAHLTASVLDQVYRGTSDTAAVRAARETAGEVLTWGAAPIAAYFSASCGGRGESAEAAFNLAPGTTPYIHGGESDDDEHAWTRSVKLDDLTAALRDRIGAAVKGMRVSSRTASGRAKTIALETSAGRKPLPAVELRQLLGYREIPSLLFDVKTDGNTAVFTGRGSGHGVGLCQWGAQKRASRGATYREILAHYYPGAEIRRMY